MKIQSLLLLSLLLFLPSEAKAQSSVRICNTATPQDCAAITGSALAVSGTFSASLGGFTPSAAGARMTPLTVTVADSSGTLPTGAVVVVSNVGATNPMYCNVNGIAATTSDQLIGANSWFAFTIPAAVTTLHCIATGGSTTANGVGGAGLPTGAGGGGGSGGGGGAVTVADGADVAQGATTDVAVAVGGTGTLSAKMRLITTQLNTINTTLGTPMQTTGGTVGLVAGSAVIGHVICDSGCSGSGGTSSNFGSAFPSAGTAIGLSDTTNMQKWLTALALGDGVNGNNTGAVANWLYNGTTWDRARGDATNGAFVNVKTSVLPTGASTAAKQPALGTAGSASADVLTVQGIASMTPLLANPGTAANWGVLAQGSTTSGELGHLVLGAVTTSAPSYTTAQSSPLSLDTAGNLRVNVVAGGGAVTVADGADVTQGAKADSAAGTGTVSIVSILKQLHLDVTGAIPAGTAIIGKVGVDQTTPGTTNGVAIVGVNAATALAGNGVTGTGSQRVTIASDNTPFAVKIDQTTPGTTNGVQVNAALPAGTNIIGSTSNDVCSNAAKTNLPISFQATASAQLIALSGSTKIYICSLSLIASAATVFSITGGTGTNCGTPAALIGTTVAAHGLSLAANGGLTLGNGAGTVAVTAAGSELCIVQSGSGDLVGNLTYVQQ